MKVGAKINKTLSVEQAYLQLEEAVNKFIRHVEWVNPYSAFGPQFKAKIKELHQPYLELQFAKRKKKA